MVSSFLTRLTNLDYKAAITIILIVADLVERTLSANYVQPIIVDGWVGIALGFWFGASKKNNT